MGKCSVEEVAVRIKFKILEMVESEAEVKEVLQFIEQNYDFNRELQRYKPYLFEHHCKKCGKGFKPCPPTDYRGNTYALELLPVDHSYCETCKREVVGEAKQQQPKCEICGDVSSEPICHWCVTSNADTTSWRYSINSQNSRARKLGLEGTLTMAQWEIAIRYFDGRCAYCSISPVQIVEHFIPLQFRERGTTKYNCIPACNSCNRKKGGLHPDRHKIKKISSDALVRVADYLAIVDSLSLAQLRQNPTKTMVGKPLYEPKRVFT